MKGFVLAETLRLEEESLDRHSDTALAAQLNAHLAFQLPLKEDVFSLGAPVMNPPNWTGQVTLRTALEAMIGHSDNSATDIFPRHADLRGSRRSSTNIGLQQAQIPASTLLFFGNITGVPDRRPTTQADLQTATRPRRLTRSSTTRSPWPARRRTSSPSTPARCRASSCSTRRRERSSAGSSGSPTRSHSRCRSASARLAKAAASTSRGTAS
ncbi:MAG: class A beta-lactamase-related serine hydrolase [Chloroflexi bacterium]|nr:class A beta-lactamase-related serine hydrolase [Chloroflexota bacterium]